MFSTRQPASRTTAKASGRISSSDGLQGLVFLVGIFDGIDALANALAKFVGLGAELLVGELLHRRLERVDLLDQRRNALEFAFVTGAKNGGDYFIDVMRVLSCDKAFERRSHFIVRCAGRRIGQKGNEQKRDIGRRYPKRSPEAPNNAVRRAACRVVHNTSPSNGSFARLNAAERSPWKIQYGASGCVGLKRVTFSGKLKA